LAELLKLVNTLLDFSRIEAGRVQAVYAPMDLGGGTSEIAGAFRSAMENAGLQLSVECPPIAEPVYVDRDMWEKVVSNLRSNAFKFTFEGSVTVTLKSMESAVQLQVRDTGGFPRSTESALGLGSAFTVTIPLGTIALPPERIQATRSVASPGVTADVYAQEAKRRLAYEPDIVALYSYREPGPRVS
jgi:signal transduction histidine kinase